MSLFNILFNRNKFEKPAKITLKNIGRYLQGNIRLLKLKLGLYPKDYHRREQWNWRIKQVRLQSPICLEQGSCRVCGCDTEGLILSDPPCEGNCFPKMMTARDWENFKLENNIK